MKISIITVCYNSEKTIERAINSVLSQSYKNIEYIIIDGKSSDNTLSIINNYKNSISKIISEKDNGIYDAMNKGIDSATGDYLFFLNSDDYLYNENVIEKIVLNSYEQPEIIYGNLVCANEDGLKIKKQNQKLNKIYLMKNVPCQPTMLFHKNVFNKVGKFRTDYKIVSDFEWIVKAFLKFNVTNKYIDVDINVFNIGGVSTSEKHNSIHDKERNEILNEYFLPKERKRFDFVSKYLRSITNIPILSDILNIFIKFKL